MCLKVSFGGTPSPLPPDFAAAATADSPLSADYATAADSPMPLGGAPPGSGAGHSVASSDDGLSSGSGCSNDHGSPSSNTLPMLLGLGSPIDDDSPEDRSPRYPVNPDRVLKS